jgi:hypothetical protein
MTKKTLKIIGLLVVLLFKTLNANDINLNKMTPEDKLWKEVKEYDQPEMYREYLKTFPQGTYTRIAKVRLRQTKPKWVTTKKSNYLVHEIIKMDAKYWSDLNYREKIDRGFSDAVKELQRKNFKFNYSHGYRKDDFEMKTFQDYNGDIYVMAYISKQ